MQFEIGRKTSKGLKAAVKGHCVKMG